MDFRARDQTWLDKIDEVFKQRTGLILETDGCDVKEGIAKLKDLLYRRTKLWWNKAYLENYLTKQLIPRGLRVQVFPSFPIENEAVKLSWENLANECSRGFMSILIRLNQESLAEIEKEIEPLQNDIRSKLSNDDLVKLNDDLDSQFQKWEKEVGDLKAEKYQRDYNDQQTNNVYRWGQQRKNRYRSGYRSRSSSISSQTSVEGSQRVQELASTPHPHQGGQNQREKKKQKRKRSPPQKEGKRTRSNTEL